MTRSRSTHGRPPTAETTDAAEPPTETGVPLGAAGSATSRPALMPALILVIVGLVALGALVGAVAGRATAPNSTAAMPTPNEHSAEAGFARDMQTHHAQAVQMSMLIRDRTNDPEIRSLSYDIALTQQQQIGQMYAWLTLWDLPQTSARQPMAWMTSSGEHPMDMTESADSTGPGGDNSRNSGAVDETPDGDESMTGHDMSSMPGMNDEASAGDDRGTSEPEPRSSIMPGMATPQELQRLTDLRGVAAEQLFLTLMIKHHRGGIAMAQAVLDASEDPDVRLLAQTMVTGQTAEITAMQAMLDERATR